MQRHRQHAHQRFVKTTPKPRATKNSNGEEPPPPPLDPPLLPPLLPLVVVGDGEESAEVGVSEMEVGAGVGDVVASEAMVEAACLT